MPRREDEEGFKRVFFFFSGKLNGSGMGIPALSWLVSPHIYNNSEPNPHEFSVENFGFDPLKNKWRILLR